MKIPVQTAVLFAGLLAGSLARVSVGADFAIEYYEQARGLEIEPFVQQKSDGTVGSVDLSFDAFGRSFSVQLELNTRLMDKLDRKQSIELFAGRLAGVEQSWARVAVTNDGIHAMIWDGAELYIVEPAHALPAEVSTTTPTDTSVVFRLSDVSTDGTHFCPVHRVAHGKNLLADYVLLVDDLRKNAGTTPKALPLLSIGLVADVEFTQRHADPTAAMLARMNAVDGIYFDQVGISFDFPVIDVFANEPDPFSGTDAGALLTQFSDFKAGSATHNPMGLSHLWTGRELDGQTVGIAFLDVLCRARLGVGLSGGNGSVSFDSLIAAHEIGHNFGADHDGDPQGSCPNTPETFIMAPQISGQNTFSPCSLGVMQQAINVATCLSTLTSFDLSITAPTSLFNVVVDQSVQATLTVENEGTEDQTNVVVNATVPAGLEFVTAVPDSGTCSSVAGGFSCTLGTIPFLGTRNIDVSLDAVDIGSFQVPVNVASDMDDDLTNNNLTLNAVVSASIDLQLTGSGPSTLQLNETGRLNYTIVNASNRLNATATTLNIVVPNGLTVENTSEPGCNFITGFLGCLGLTVPQSGSLVVTVDIRAVQTGTQFLSGQVTGPQADPVPANNSANLSIIVPSSGGGGGGSGGNTGGGGGGAFGVFLAVAIAGLRRRRFH